MKRLTAAVCSAAAIFLAPAALAGAGPVETVEAFYLDAPEGERDPARFTGPALEALQRNAEMEASGDYGCLDFSFVFDAQDFDARQVAESLDVRVEAQDGAEVTVVAGFVNFGRAQEIVWTLREVDGEWLVADVAQPDGAWALSTLCE